MRSNPHISFALLMVFVLLLSTSLPAAAGSTSFMDYSNAAFTTINFVSNIETIGVAVSGTGLPSTAQLSYRRSGESLWHSGHGLVRIDDGRLIGSLFNLSPATSYDIKVSDGSSEINGSASTQPDQLSFTPSVVLHVNDDALPGGNGSITAPFQKIQDAVNQAGPGTQVLVADGMYREAITFPASGTTGNWIQVKAAGNAAILDSADYLSGSIWTSTSTAKVWFTRLTGPVAYLSKGGNRFYQYDDKTGLMQAKGHAGVAISEGWYYEASTQRLYIRSLDNPASYMWRLPRLNHAFDIAARDWIWIEGFEVRFYGTTTNGCGVCTLNASHVVIRNNKIHNMQLGIFINWTGGANQGNDTRIEGNEVYDPLVNEWPWAAVKGSFMEGTGIIIRGRAGAIVRDNHVHNFFNGIYTGSSGALENPELAFDADIYNNYIHHVSDDGLEPEGACINQRFRNNKVDRSFVGLSIAPITQGPTWVLRNAFTNITGRGIKFANNSDGKVLIYHNTGWTSTNNINGMDLITSVHNVAMRNNTFQSTGYSFAAARTGSTANDWNHNNWYTTRGSTGPHFKWENINYNTISALCTASGLECDGYENFPGFTNPTGGDFTLLSASPNIDRGVVIPGINDDFAGNAPDVGAYEFAFDPPPTVLSSVRANSDPTYATNVDFTVTFSKLVTGVNNSDFSLTTTGVTGASITNVRGSGAHYTVSVNTGLGNGTIRLDVVDDDSIMDVSNHPLGGVGTGNGNYASGEMYTVNKTVSLTGNAGVANATLSYIDDVAKSVIADGSGNYSITIPGGWSGTVTPARA
ncbi:MAG TPA: right-handed parallel beta-helix repeat-containing protein, partial [Anaerolineales bacterium]